MKDILKTTDHRYYEVTLVVAIPDYFGGGDNGYTALDAISQALNDDAEIVVLEMAQTEVELVVKAATTKPVASAVTTTTYTNIVNADVVLAKKATAKKATAKATTRKQNNRPANSHVAWTDEMVCEVIELKEKGVGNKEIAKITGRSASAIGNCIYYYYKGNKS